MQTTSPALPEPTPAVAKQKGKLLVIGQVLLVIAFVYLTMAYLVMPRLWKRYEKRHSKLASIPGITHTGNGVPGDPLNVALIGSETDVKKILLKAKWVPADPLTLKSCLKIAEASVFKRSYEF